MGGTLLKRAQALWGKGFLPAEQTSAERGAGYSMVCSVEDGRQAGRV